MDRPRDREPAVPAVGGGRDWDRPRRGLDGLVEAVVSPWKGHVTPPGPEEPGPAGNVHTTSPLFAATAEVIHASMPPDD